MQQDYSTSLNQASVIAKYQSSGEDARSLMAHADFHTSPVCPQKVKKSISNHQALLRKKLRDIQREKSETLEAEIAKNLKSLKHRKMTKEKEFQHVQSKVFETLSNCTVSTEATLTSSLESLSVLSSDENICKRPNYGRVPKYILKRKIEEGRKATAVSNGSKSLVSPEVECPRKRSDVVRIRNEYDEKIKAVKDSLRGLPFGFVLKKREHLENSLKQLQYEKASVQDNNFTIKIKEYTNTYEC